LLFIAHFSAIGVVLSKLVQGTLTSILFFVLWVSFSLVIFFGAELAQVLNERQNERLRAQAQFGQAGKPLRRPARKSRSSRAKSI